MKNLKTSFLFFVFTSVFCSINTNSIFAQQKADSLSYYYNVITNPESNVDLAKGYNYFKKHKETSIDNNQLEKAIYDLRMMASVEKKLGLLSDSEISSVEALKLLDKIDSKNKMLDERIGVYNHLGIIYRDLNNYAKSLEFYYMILEQVTNVKDEANVLNNIGNVYSDQGDYKLALEKYNEAYNKSSKLDNKTKARILSNLGHIQSKLGFPEAISNLIKAKEIRESINYTSGLLTSYNHLVEYYKTINDKETALNYANKALELARSSNNSLYLESALSNLMELNDSPEVVEYASLKDSIETAKQKAKDNFAYYRYQFSEKDRLYKESELKREKLFILMILIISSSILIYFIIRVRHKKEKIEQVYNTESRISKKIHDEVANDIYYVISKIQSDNYDVLDNLENIYDKTRDISRENSAIDLEGDFNEYLNDMLLSFMGKSVTVITNNINKVNWNQISKVKKTTIYRVLQELMVNMKKHSNATHTILKFSQEFGNLFIDYKDNGNGCNLIKRGGLVNVENRIKTINGTIKFESKPNNGFHAKIKV